MGAVAAGGLLFIRPGAVPHLALPTLHPPSPQAKADAEVRWAVLNVVSLLRSHEAAHDALAAAMQRGASVGECIAVIERELARSPATAPPAQP